MKLDAAARWFGASQFQAKNIEANLTCANLTFLFKALQQKVTRAEEDFLRFSSKETFQLGILSRKEAEGRRQEMPQGDIKEEEEVAPCEFKRNFIFRHTLWLLVQKEFLLKMS